MNKAELIDAVADSADLSKAAAGRALDAAIEAITKASKKETRHTSRIRNILSPQTSCSYRYVIQERVRLSKSRLLKFLVLRLEKLLRMP